MERRLVERAMRGDEEAFDMLVERIGNSLYSVVLMDIGPDHTIAIQVDAANTTDVAAMAQRAAPIIGTFRFHE